MRIDELTELQKLDIEIAQRVFGEVWVTSQELNQYRWLCNPEVLAVSEGIWQITDADLELLDSAPVLEYSLHLNHALYVIEAMQVKGIVIALIPMMESTWLIDAFYVAQEKVFRDELPVGICRMALRVLNYLEKKEYS